MTNPNLPAAWSNAEILDGLETVNKVELIGVPILLTSCYFENNSRGILICYIDGERTDGSSFTFTDSSSGIMEQLKKRLREKGQDGAIESGETVALGIVAPNGLRISEYLVPARNPNGQVIPGKMIPAQTFYLTTSGQRKRVADEKPAARRKPAAS